MKKECGKTSYGKVKIACLFPVGGWKLYLILGKDFATILVGRGTGEKVVFGKLLAFACQRLKLFTLCAAKMLASVRVGYI